MSIPATQHVILSIIIVNFNGRPFLNDCLRSIQEHVSYPHEVIVVDNASTDSSVDYIRTYFPHVRLHVSPVNTGFTGGNNLGAQLACGDYFLLLNNDTYLRNDVTPALEMFKNPLVGVVGCRLFYGDGRQQASIGYEHTPIRLVLSWLGLSRYSWLPTVFRRAEEQFIFYERAQCGVAWVSGAGLFTPKALWNKLEGLDARYFMYLEDVDYCKMVRHAGYVICYTPAVQVTHYEGAGRSWIGEKALMNSMTSYILYTRKFYGPFSASIMRLCLGIVMLARSTIYAIQLLLKPSLVLVEKRRGYFTAAQLLFRKKF